MKQPDEASCEDPAPTVMAGLDPAVQPNKTLHFQSWIA